MKEQTRKIVNFWKKSFGRDKNCLRVFLYDLLFFAIIIPCIYVFFKLIEMKAQSLRVGDLEQYLATASAAELQMLSTHLRGFVFYFCIGVTILFLVALFGYTLSRSLIWNRLTGKRFYAGKYAKFLVLNLMMFLVFAAFIIFYVFVLMKFRPIVFLVLLYFILLLIMYVVFLIKMSYARTSSIFRSIRLGFEKINWTVYLLLLPLYAVFLAASFFLSMMLSKWVLADFTATIILLVMFWTWMRKFMINADAVK
jgi:hypothetical protein